MELNILNMQQQQQELTASSMQSGAGIPFSAWSYNSSIVAQGPGAPLFYLSGREQALSAPEVVGECSSRPFSGFAELIRGGNIPPLQFSYPCGQLGGSSSADRQRSLLLQQGVDVTKMTAQEIVEAKALAASRSHSEAERRRRERINNHLATLRSLLPNTTKTDKASLLAEVIQHVKELKRLASDIEQGSPLPSEADEVSVDSDLAADEGTGKLLIRASLCCEDRPDLLTDVNKTLRALRLRAVKAEMSTLGGRVKNVLVVTGPSENHPNNLQEQEETETSTPSVSAIQEALKALLERQNSGELSPTAGSKRQRQVG